MLSHSADPLLNQSFRLFKAQFPDERLIYNLIRLLQLTTPSMSLQLKSPFYPFNKPFMKVLSKEKKCSQRLLR